jgi:hypothetical protein
MTNAGLHGKFRVERNLATRLTEHSPSFEIIGCYKEEHQMDRDQDQRDRAYKIWEDEGRPHGQHDEHWRRAQEQHERTDQEAAEVTEANQHASDEFNGKEKPKGSPIDRPPSTVAPD